MEHRICRVTEFKIISPYTLSIGFEDTSEQIVDFLPVLRGELYGPLRDPTLFNTVAIDPETHTLVWANGADFDPATLYDWPLSGLALAEMASRWEPVLA